MNRESVARLAEILGLTTIAISIPVLDVLGSNPNFLLAHGLTRGRVVLLSLLVAFVPFIVLAVVESLTSRLSEPFGAATRLAIRATMVALLGVQPLSRLLTFDSATGLILGVSLCLVAGWALARLDVVGAISRMAAWTAPLVVAIFLYWSPVSAIQGGVASAAVEDRGANEKSVVWVIFDQFPLTLMLDRSGEIDADRFPNFASLESVATWYSNATTVSPETSIAVPAALTGRIPHSAALPTVSQHPQNLFTILSASHEVSAYETFTQLCPDSVCDEVEFASNPSFVADMRVVAVRSVLPSRLADLLVPKFDSSWAGFGSVDVSGVDLHVEGEAKSKQEALHGRVRGDDREVVERFLTDLETSTGPSLHYLHLEKPHEPLIFLPDGRTYDFCSCFRLDSDGRWPRTAMTDHRLQRYVLQAMYVDSVLGAVVASMRRSRLWDDAVLVVMSDHGASLLPGTPNRELTQANAVEILPVPLFVRAPGMLAPGRNDSRVQVIDLFPTVVDILGMRASESLDGRSFFETGDPRKVSLVVDDVTHEWSYPVVVSDSGLLQFMSGVLPEAGNPYAFGEYGAMLGRESPASVATSQLRLDLSTSSQLSVFTADYAPTHVIGEVLRANRPVDLAAVVGGRVAGLGRTYLFDGRWQLTLMLDPSLVAAGETISIFEIDSGEFKLVPPVDPSG